MKFIFVIGYQQKYSNLIETMDTEKLGLMRASINNRNNYVFFINYMFDKKEESYIPSDVLSRGKLCPETTSLIYMEENKDDIEMKISIESALLFTGNSELITGEDSEKKEIDGIEIFNMTDKIDEGVKIAKKINKYTISKRKPMKRPITIH